MRFSSALILFAHPDDAEFGCGGTVAAWASEGTDVHYVVITDGSAGNNEPGWTRPEISKVRKQEQRAAAEILGVRSVTFLDVPDGMLEVNLDTRRAVTREVRRIRADVLVAPDPSRLWSGRAYINHADHKAAGELALCAVMPDSPSRPQFPELLREGFEPFEIPNLWLIAEEADTYVDITKTIDVKIQSLAAHGSQQADVAAPWVRERARELGHRAGYEYAEGFRTFGLADEEEEGT
jgi:LmbE family N-acetylglucosaminyl deacetylase